MKLLTGTIALTCALFNFAHLSAASDDSKARIDFKDSRGQEWSRWVLQEKTDSGTLLLVVENPKNHDKDEGVTQRVVFRKLFAEADQTSLLKSSIRFSQLVDRSESEPSEADLSASRDGKNPIWTPVKDHWTEQDEKDYADWYTKTVTTSLLVGSGIIVDCADFAISVRWIYAHDHLLPAGNSLSGSGKLFGHWSKNANWDKLTTDADWHKDERFKAALKYMLKSSYTHSVIDDLYPVRLSRDTVTPGSVLLILYSASTGHTEVINSLGRDPSLCPSDECISVLYGNEPSAETAYKDQAYIRNLGENGGGFLRWRWPYLSNGAWKLTPKNKMLGYSLEQYSQVGVSDGDFQQFVYATIGLVMSDVSQMNLAANSMFNQLLQRQDNTTMGYFYCSVQACDPSSSLYSDYSTPSRDKRFRETRTLFLTSLAKLAPDDSNVLSLKSWIESYQPTYGGPNFWDYLINTASVSDLMSSDPTRSYFERWGTTPAAPLNQLMTLSDVWRRAWMQREQVVASATALCFPNGAATPTCDAHSTEVLALATDRLDESLRRVRRDLRTQLAQASQADHDAVRLNQSNYSSNENYCGTQGDQYCSIDDLLYSAVDAVEKMSSSPTAPAQKRYGF